MVHRQQNRRTTQCPYITLRSFLLENNIWIQRLQQLVKGWRFLFFYRCCMLILFRNINTLSTIFNKQNYQIAAQPVKPDFMQFFVHIHTENLMLKDADAYQTQPHPDSQYSTSTLDVRDILSSLDTQSSTFDPCRARLCPKLDKSG